MAGKRVIPLTVAEVQYVAVELAREWFAEFNEPIPPFETRYPHVLEACIETPFMRLGRRDAYPGLIPKATTLFYLLIKGHPFLNGNKRIAITTLLHFLGKNGKWVKIPARDFYDLANWVAGSKQPDEKELAMNLINATLRKVVVDTLPKMRIPDSAR